MRVAGYEIVRSVQRFFEAVFAGQRVLFQTGKNQHAPTVQRSILIANKISWWKRSAVVVVGILDNRDLLDVVFVRNPACRFTRCSSHGQEHREQNTYGTYNNENFDNAR